MDSSIDLNRKVKLLIKNKLIGSMKPYLAELSVGLAVAVGAMSIFYFHIDFGTALQTGLQATFIIILSVFGLQFIGTRIVRTVKSRQKTKTQGQEEESKAKYDAKSKVSRELSQQEFDKKAESYKERILDPREEVRKAKKEEEFQRFLGPAWKGKGAALGGADVRSHDSQEVHGREAADLRQLPETEIKNLPKPKEPKQKKVIVLPEEPPEDDPEGIVVVLRTPVQTVHKRRFPPSAIVQNVLDYMTTVGFHQIGYTISTSYPRQNLSDQKEQTLAELGFYKQVVLNVEERESES